MDPNFGSLCEDFNFGNPGGILTYLIQSRQDPDGNSMEWQVNISIVGAPAPASSSQSRCPEAEASPSPGGRVSCATTHLLQSLATDTASLIKETAA